MGTREDERGQAQKLHPLLYSLPSSRFLFSSFFLSLSQSTQKKHSSKLISLSLSYLFLKLPSLLVSSFPRKQEKESGVFGLWGILMVTFFGGGGLSFVSLSLSLSLSLWVQLI